jgi:hypothetical protein
MVSLVEALFVKIGVPVNNRTDFDKFLLGSRAVQSKQII